MPHSLFLGSALATQDRITSDAEAHKSLFTESSASSSQSEFETTTESASWWQSVRRFLHRCKVEVIHVFRIIPMAKFANQATTHAEHDNRPLAVVRAHIYHGTIDMVVSLLGFAVVINSMYDFNLPLCFGSSLTLFCRILILASAVFFYGSGSGSGGPASLFDAYDLLRDLVGQRMFDVYLYIAG